MKKLYSFIAAGLMLTSAAQLSAQCGGGRYHDYIFPTPPTPMSNIVYGSNVTATGATLSLKLDVYQPVGDTATSRALIIIAHGGSFYTGSKIGPDVTPLAKDFAKMGYVTASIDYRLGMTNFPFADASAGAAGHTVDSTDAGAAVMRAVHDGRAAVRFFRKNAAIGGNTYKIDTNKIYFAGVSAGGFVAVHIAYMDLLSEFPSYVDTTGVHSGTVHGQPGMSGGLEGNSGNPGYSSKVNGVINICGALGDTAWMSPGDVPIQSFHGTNDNTVPYGSATIYLAGSFPLLVVDGSASIALQADNLGIVNCFETFEGADHTPEISGGTAATKAAYYDTIIVEARNFLEHLNCGIALNCNYTMALGVNNHTADADFMIYPNPAGNSATIDLTAFENEAVSIELYDAMGRQVKNISNIKVNQYTLERNNLPSGIYFMSVLVEGKIRSKKI
ncbi:MAG: T9SS type A sorting domain-containing protein, partial [Bacteroidetes bacterium]|nr:T9SS type A sorting domain-containing protein [Bacteroidota bacterium]